MADIERVVVICDGKPDIDGLRAANMEIDFRVWNDPRAPQEEEDHDIWADMVVVVGLRNDAAAPVRCHRIASAMETVATEDVVVVMEACAWSVAYGSPRSSNAVLDSATRFISIAGYPTGVVASFQPSSDGRNWVLWRGMFWWWEWMWQE